MLLVSCENFQHFTAENGNVLSLPWHICPFKEGGGHHVMWKQFCVLLNSSLNMHAVLLGGNSCSQYLVSWFCHCCRSRFDCGSIYCRTVYCCSSL